MNIIDNSQQRKDIYLSQFGSHLLPPNHERFMSKSNRTNQILAAIGYVLGERVTIDGQTNDSNVRSCPSSGINEYYPNIGAVEVFTYLYYSPYGSSARAIHEDSGLIGNILEFVANFGFDAGILNDSYHKETTGQLHLDGFLPKIQHSISPRSFIGANLGGEGFGGAASLGADLKFFDCDLTVGKLMQIIHDYTPQESTPSVDYWEDICHKYGINTPEQRRVYTYLATVPYASQRPCACNLSPLVGTNSNDRDKFKINTFPLQEYGIGNLYKTGHFGVNDFSLYALANRRESATFMDLEKVLLDLSYKMRNLAVYPISSSETCYLNVATDIPDWLYLGAPEWYPDLDGDPHLGTRLATMDAMYFFTFDKDTTDFPKYMFPPGGSMSLDDAIRESKVMSSPDDIDLFREHRERSHSILTSDHINMGDKVKDEDEEKIRDSGGVEQEDVQHGDLTDTFRSYRERAQERITPDHITD